MTHVFFVAGDFNGLCVYAGHFNATDASAARQAARAAFTKDVATGRSMGRSDPEWTFDDLTLRVRRSKVSPQNAFGAAS